MQAPTRIQLCGRLSVEWDGEHLERELPGRQGRLLFAYLVLHRDRAVRRDELVEALWSEDGPPPGGDALLAPPLSRLRRALGPGRLEGRGELALVLPGDAWVDWEAAHAGLAQAQAALAGGDPAGAWEAGRTALAVADGGLLPGLEARWIEARRAELADLRLEALEAVAAAGVALGGAHLAPAESAARAAVEAAPFRESARAALLGVLRARGNVAEALRAFEELRTLLREELGTGPGRALLALHEELLRADEPARAAEPARPAPSPAAAAPPRPDGLPDRLAQAAATPFVGRQAPLERLRRELARAVAGESGLVLITGEGGIGKTRLIAELARGADGVCVLYGRCDEEELFPFGPWIELLGGHLARLPDAELPALLGAEGPELARLLPELRARVPGLPEAPGGDPESERRRLFAAVVALVRRLAAAGPLLVVIDDLHWADRSSLLLGRQLVRADALGRALLLGTYRDTELGERHPLVEILADLERDRPLERLHLTGLAEDEVAALVGASHAAGLEADTVRAIRQETDGNPFFVKQLVRHLEEAGGGQALRPGGGLGVPAGVRDVIARRVARLPEPAGQVLRVAALVGRDFELEVVEAVLGVPEDELLDLLDAAVRAGILVEVASAPGRYSFAHALLRATLEDELTATRRARLHRRIGEAIEQRHRDRLDPWLVDLARHFGAAGPAEVDRAVSYAVRAAEQATARLAYEEAVDLLAGALDARERDEPVDEGERARLLCRLAAATWRTARWEEARGIYARAAAAARAAGSATVFAQAALGHSGGIFERYGTEDAQSRELLEEALRRLPEEDSPLRTQVLARLSGVLYYSAESEARGPALADEAVAMARRVRDPEASVAAFLAALYANWRPGRQEVRLALADELVALTERLGAVHVEAVARVWRACVLLELCRLEDADADVRRHGELAARLQEPELVGHAAALRSMRALLEGRWEEGVREAEATVTGSETTPMALQFYGVELLARRNVQGRLGEMVPWYERLVREIGALPGWRTALAWAQVQAGRVDLAREQIDALRPDGVLALPNDTNLIPACTILSHIAAELDDAALAEEIEPLLRPHAATWVVLGPGPATLGPVAYCLGLLGLLRGDLDGAERDLLLAVDLAERMRARPYLALARVALAEALRRRDAPGDAERAAEAEALGLAGARELDMTHVLRAPDAGLDLPTAAGAPPRG